MLSRVHCSEWKCACVVSACTCSLEWGLSAYGTPLQADGYTHSYILIVLL